MATTIELITQIYVGYFDRAPDPEGLNYWIGRYNDGMTLAEIAQSFSVQPESTSNYPYLANPNVASSTAFITAVYANLFNRTPDAEGLAYWEGQLAAGRPVGSMILDIINGAVTNPDAAILANKVEVGIDWVQSVVEIEGFVYDADAAASAEGVLDGVDDTAASVAAAKAETDSYVAGGVVPGDSFVLTTASGETAVGTSGNDTFSATVDAAGLGATPAATLNPTDVIDGAGGRDTANITATSAAAAVLAGAVKNVEIVNLISDIPADGFAAVNASNFAGVEQLWQIGATASTDVSGVSNGVTVGFNAGSVADLQMATGATTANIALANVTSGGTINIGETTAGTLTTANVSGSVAGAGALTIDLDTAAGTGGVAASAETTVDLDITSNGTITINSTTAKTVDASGSTGNLTIVAPAAVETLKGGSGNDALTGSGVSKLIEGGAGADTIIAGNVAGEVINGGANGTGAGNKFDTITLGAAGQAQIVLTEAGHSGLTAATIDQVTGFTSGADKLDFNLAAGSATNFLDGGASSGVTDALTNANTAFDGTVQYFSTNVGGNTLVFVDVNLDGTADMAVQLTGTAAVVATDFIA